MTALPVGAATLDVDARTLAGPCRTVHLDRQPLRLLARLAEQPGRAVFYEHLVAALDDRYGRADTKLVQAYLADVRRALHASGGGGVATTIHGIGVRLDVPVRGVSPREAA